MCRVLQGFILVGLLIGGVLPAFAGGLHYQDLRVNGVPALYLDYSFGEFGQHRVYGFSTPKHSERNLDFNSDGIVDEKRVTNGDSVIVASMPLQGQFSWLEVTSRNRDHQVLAEYVFNPQSKRYLLLHKEVVPYKVYFESDECAQVSKVVEDGSSVKGIADRAFIESIKGSGVIAENCQQLPFSVEDFNAIATGFAQMLDLFSPRRGKKVSRMQCLNELGIPGLAADMLLIGGGLLSLKKGLPKFTCDGSAGKASYSQGSGVISLPRVKGLGPKEKSQRYEKSLFHEFGHVLGKTKQGKVYEKQLSKIGACCDGQKSLSELAKDSKCQEVSKEIKLKRDKEWRRRAKIIGLLSEVEGFDEVVIVMTRVTNKRKQKSVLTEVSVLFSGIGEGESGSYCIEKGNGNKECHENQKKLVEARLGEFNSLCSGNVNVGFCKNMEGLLRKIVKKNMHKKSNRLPLCESKTRIQCAKIVAKKKPSRDDGGAEPEERVGSSEVKFQAAKKATKNSYFPRGTFPSPEKEIDLAKRAVSSSKTNTLKSPKPNQLSKSAQSGEPSSWSTKQGVSDQLRRAAPNTPSSKVVGRAPIYWDQSPTRSQTKRNIEKALHDSAPGAREIASRMVSAAPFTPSGSAKSSSSTKKVRPRTPARGSRPKTSRREVETITHKPFQATVAKLQLTEVVTDLFKTGPVSASFGGVHKAHNNIIGSRIAKAKPQSDSRGSSGRDSSPSVTAATSSSIKDTSSHSGTSSGGTIGVKSSNRSVSSRSTTYTTLTQKRSGVGSAQQKSNAPELSVNQVFKRWDYGRAKKFFDEREGRKFLRDKRIRVRVCSGRSFGSKNYRLFYLSEGCSSPSGPRFVPRRKR